jgi:hypothetical protein
MALKCTETVTVVKEIVYKAIETFVTTVETVCTEVTKTIKEIQKQVQKVCETVQKKVCKWLPWPANKLCNWVTDTVCKWVDVWVEVLVTVVETVCQLVTTIVKVLILVPLTIFITVVTFICFWVDFIATWVEIIVTAIGGLLEFLTCMLGVNVRKHLHICVTVLANSDGVPVRDAQGVAQVLAETERIISRRMNVRLHIHGQKTISVADDHLDVIACDASQLFSGDAIDLTGDASGTFADLFGCSDDVIDAATSLIHNVLDVIFIRDIIEGDDVGCHIPGTDYVIIDAQSSGLVLAHEIGHACDLWHVSAANNLMNHFTASDEVESWQRCIFRRSRFVYYLP